MTGPQMWECPLERPLPTGVEYVTAGPVRATWRILRADDTRQPYEPSGPFEPLRAFATWWRFMLEPVPPHDVPLDALSVELPMPFRPIGGA